MPPPASPDPGFLQDQAFLREAIALSRRALDDDVGGPFGAVVVRAGRVLARGRNRVLADQDPTAHAEVVALRRAARTAGTHDLSGCTVYASCEPCPMCRAALHWARVERIVYAADRGDAEAAGFDDARLHAAFREAPGEDEDRPTVDPRLQAEAASVLAAWARRPGRRLY